MAVFLIRRFISITLALIYQVLLINLLRTGEYMHKW